MTTHAACVAEPTQTGFPGQVFSGDRYALTDFVGIDLADLLELCTYNPLDDFVIASGSVVEGFGNRSSDIDLFVVRELAAPSVECFLYEPKSKRHVDITYVSKEEICQLLQRIRGVQAVPSDWVSLQRAAFPDIDIYHRLLIGVSLTDPLGDDWRKYKFCRRSVGREIAYQSIVAGRARWIDAVGAFLDGQREHAAYVARVAFEHSVDAYAALNGETNPSPKWRWARLQRLAASGRDQLQIFQFFREAAGLTPRLSLEDLLRYAGTVLSEAQALLTRGHLHGLDPLTDPCARYEPVGEFDYILRMVENGEVIAQRYG